MLGFVLSQPRSGSTVLSAMLDRRKGVVCLPESSFPQVLGAITKKERQDRRWLAALYLGSTFPPLPRPPTPLSLDEAEECMKGNDTDILLNLGFAVAEKMGKPKSLVNSVVWKTTRTPGMQQTPVRCGGKFIILRRSSLNVYLSQFSVEFGKKNRNPWRFALTKQSYEYAFSKIPADKRISLEYDQIPKQFENILKFLNVPNQNEWDCGINTIEMVSARASWLKNSTKPFINKDVEKIKNLDRRKACQLKLALLVTRPMRKLMGPARTYYDNWSLDHARMIAKMHVNGEI